MRRIATSLGHCWQLSTLRILLTEISLAART